MPTNAAGPVLWETERLIAREWSEADAEAAFEMYGDIEVMRGLSGIVEADLESQGANLRKAIAAYRERPRGTGYWALVRKEDGRIVGASLVKPIPGDEEKIEIGWHLAKAHWGKGYATEAAREAIRVAFEHLPIDRLYCIVRPWNERSLRVAERLAFVRLPGLRRYYDTDVVLLELLRPA